MKAVIFILLIILPFVSLGQSYQIDSTTTQAKYESIVDLPGTKAEIFSKGFDWVTNTYNNPSSVINQSDKESGQLFVTGSFLNKSYFKEGLNQEVESKVKYDRRFYIKDDKYKILITKISFDGFLLDKSTLLIL